MTTTTEPSTRSSPPSSPGQRLMTRVIRHPALVPVAAVVVAILIGAIIIAAAGISPVTAYAAVLTGALDPSTLDYTLSVWALICGMGIAAAIPLRMGEFNLGGNGQLVLGGLAAALVAGELALPSIITIPLALVFAAVISGVFGAVSAPLSTRLGIPIIISTLLLSPLATAAVSYLVRFQIGQEGSAVAQTERFPESAHLWKFGELFYTNAGIVIVVLMLTVFWVVDSRSSVGFEIRVIGANRRFGAYGGVRVGRLAFGSMAASGAAAGIIGAIIVLSSPYRLIDGALLSPGYTFAGLAAALLAGGRPAFIPLTAVMFTILQVGGSSMEQSADVPRQLSDVLQGVVITVLALRTVIDSRRVKGNA